VCQLALSRHAFPRRRVVRHPNQRARGPCRKRFLMFMGRTDFLTTSENRDTGTLVVRVDVAQTSWLLLKTFGKMASAPDKAASL
jgi:hypothetical protein